MTPAWWVAHREKMPDMVIGAEGWDMVFKVLAEEWADGGAPLRTLGLDAHFWGQSRAFLDGVCWHIPHHAPWLRHRRTGKDDGAGAYNRALAREFFIERENQEGLAMVALSESRRDKRL
jgi:hypothetical protein